MSVVLEFTAVANVPPKAVPSDFDRPHSEKLDAIQSELDSSQAWDNDYRERAKKVLELRKLQWNLCLMGQELHFKSSRERPDLVATAVLARCHDVQDKFQLAAQMTLRGLMPYNDASSYAAQGMEKAETNARAQIVSYFVEQQMQHTQPVSPRRKRH